MDPAPGSDDFEAVFRSERDGLYRTMLAFTGGRTDISDDATAEAFARALSRWGELRDPVAWTYRAAFRIAIDETRRDGRRGSSEGVALPAATTDLVDLMAALRSLSPNQRAAVVLRHLADLDVREVARRMNISSPTVRVHLHRARTRLRELLAEEDA